MNYSIFKKIISSTLITAIFAINIFSVFGVGTVHAQTPAETAALRAAAAADPATVGVLAPGDAGKIDGIAVKNNVLSKLGNSFGGNMVPTSPKEIINKEKILDSIWMLMAKRAIRMITSSTVNWINSGFQGNPAYVTDLNGFLLDVADAETGFFIEALGLTDLCSPWSLDIRIALALPSGQFEREVACTLSDVVANMDDFINGDFSQGGWAGWFELTTRPQNNPYGMYLMASSELDQRIASVQQERTTLLNWGNGFLSYEKCEELPAGVAGPPHCKIVTPGSVIEDQLGNVLGSGVRQLELADEFNEIVNALLSQLVVQVFTGNNGLRGISGSSDGRSSYADRLLVTEDSISIQNIITSSEIEFSRVINEELVYLASKRNTLKSFTDSEALLLSLMSCYEGKLADNSLRLTDAEKATASARIASASSTIATLITPRKNILISEINTESSVIIKLDSLLTDIQNSTNPAQLQTPTSELENMRRQDLLRGSDIFIAEQERSAVSSEMSSLDSTTNDQIAECQAFPLPLVQNP